MRGSMRNRGDKSVHAGKPGRSVPAEGALRFLPPENPQDDQKYRHGDSREDGVDFNTEIPWSGLHGIQIGMRGIMMPFVKAAADKSADQVPQKDF